MKLGKTDATTFGGQFGLFLLMFFLAGTSAAQNCGGTDRWGPKDGTDLQAPNIDLTNITSESVADLLAIHQPQLPGDNTTRIVPDEDARLHSASAIGEVETRIGRRRLPSGAHR